MFIAEDLFEDLIDETVWVMLNSDDIDSEYMY